MVVGVVQVGAVLQVQDQACGGAGGGERQVEVAAVVGGEHRARVRPPGRWRVGTLVAVSCE